MIYYCEISFKQIKPENVYPFLVEVKEQCIRNFKQIAEDNVKYLAMRLNNLQNYNVDQRELEESWVKQLFTFRYFYYSNINLLGIYGIPNSVKYLFDNTIYFQNSADQDYEFDTWNNIDTFRKIADKWKNTTDEYVIKELDLDKDQIKDLNYWRRSGCYSEIWNTYLKDTLYDKDSIIYFSCFSFYDIIHIQNFLEECKY